MRRDKLKAMATGASTGGPVALAETVPKIPPDIGVPVFHCSAYAI
jgi:chemotaxis response regulator CheB